MKKIYLLAFALGTFAFSANAQIIIEDDFDDYVLGPLSDQADHWVTWSGVEGGPEEAIVNDEQANSGSQSARWDEGEGPQDEIFLTGEQTSGNYTVSWNFYIPSGASGYFNIQGDITDPHAGDWISGNVTFNADNLSPGTGNEDSTGAIFSFPHDFWFPVDVYVDVDNMTYEITVNGTLIHAAPAPWSNGSGLQIFGGINFFAADEANTYYVDDVVYRSGIIGTNDNLFTDFAVYPNPVKDVLNIQSKTAVDNVTVYDVLGKVVLTAQPDAISPKIDMSGLSSGAYLVNVTIGNASKTVKVLKQEILIFFTKRLFNIEDPFLYLKSI